MSGEQPLESLIWRNRTLVDNCNALKKLIVAYENSLAPEDLQHLLKLGNHEGRVDAERDATKVSLRARYQDLLQSIADVQNQKKQLEKLNGLNETVMGKLTEENDALQEKVKQLENDVQNLSPVSHRIAYFLIKKTDVLAEKKEYQEELNSLLKERMDMEDMEEDLHGQLTRMKDFSNYINLIKELEQQGLKEMHKNRKQCKILSKQLEAVQQILCAQGISAEKLKTKISGLHARARMLDRDLLEFNSLTLKSKKISRTLVDNCNALKKLIVAYENSLAPEDLQHLLKLGNHEGRVDAERDATKVSLRARYQDLLQSIADVQNQKKQLEKLNGLNETVMGKLTEENDALQEKVKQLENDVQNLSPVSDRIAYFLIKKTDVLAEKKEYQEELNSLLKERMDMEDMEEDLHGQLTRMKDFSNYVNLIKELEQQVDDLRDSAKKKKQCWLLKKMWNFFLSESEIIKGNVDFLIREKREVKKKAENLEKELKVVENMISVYHNIQETHQRELDDLREKMRNCDETLESPSLWGRFLSLFCSSNLKGLKEMHKNKKQCKIHSKQLEAVQQILCAQGISTEKLKTKISGLQRASADARPRPAGIQQPDSEEQKDHQRSSNQTKTGEQKTTKGENRATKAETRKSRVNPEIGRTSGRRSRNTNMKHTPIHITYALKPSNTINDPAAGEPLEASLKTQLMS
ncbi:unnamed protein product [Tetraodon nigroviridis]|uniref:(spotted green pufferfish) hypothetical protein n=1 Tax=Tetraodon nigroviridis TaxID=99883 RepID=Q4SLP7_TETNG|nr:unnamed protein product [Tetraodon nigroviridis]